MLRGSATRAPIDAMAKFDVSIRELSKRPFSLSTGEPHRIVVSRFVGRRIEMADAHFHTDSAVLLPDEGPRLSEPGSDAPRLTSLAVLRASCLHAKNHPSSKVVVAGHTDTVGTPGYNVALSQLRADNVRAALVGDRDKWVETAKAKNIVADRQRILRFVTFTLGWDCNPGEIDNEDGPRTKKALKNFQSRYNAEFGASIAVDGVIGNETWGAFFDVYMRELRDLLEVDDAGLTSLQGGVKFVEASHAAVGCGEHHPLEGANQDEFRSQTNRRVEILFFEPGQEPRFPCHPAAKQCKPAACEIYRGSFALEMVRVDELLATQQLLLEWPDYLSSDLPKDLSILVMQEGHPEIARPWSAGEMVGGHRRFKFEPFVPALPCTLTASTGGKRTTLWELQRVDDREHPPLWQHTLEELLVNPPPDSKVTTTGELPPEKRRPGHA